MKKGCLTIFAILIILYVIGLFTNGDSGSTSSPEKVAYTCLWCKEMKVGNVGDLSCYYIDEKTGECGYHTVIKDGYGFCTMNHCDLYRAAQ